MFDEVTGSLPEFWKNQSTTSVFYFNLLLAFGVGIVEYTSII